MSSEPSNTLIHPVAHFRSPLTSKFGIPKQSGLVAELEGVIEFCPQYRNADFIRGIEGFDFLWLIWQFSANRHAATSPVVRPPVLGGNEKVGVFASRSPFRPNGLGLSSVRLKRVEHSADRGPLLHVLGGDLMDGTPIFDIKPYLPYADSHPEARSGFADSAPRPRLRVRLPQSIDKVLAETDVETLRKVLEYDPRPRYQHDAEKVYGMPFGGLDIHFRVDGEVLEVIDEFS